MNKYYAQGDVLLFKASIPKTAILDKDFNGIVQHGESGHKHALKPLSKKDYEMYYDPNSATRYLRLLKEIPLEHEEHKKIMLPPGEYEIRIVKEYDHFQDLQRSVID